MNELEDILKEFGFSDELKDYVKESADYGTYPVMSDDVVFEIEQQRVISSNSIYLSTDNSMVR